jgi:hypothetical protein
MAFLLEVSVPSLECLVRLDVCIGQLLKEVLLVHVNQFYSLFAHDLGPEQSIFPAEDHFFKAKLAPVSDLAHNLLDQDVGCVPAHLFLCHWISARVAHHEIEFHLHLTLLDEVNCV